MNKKKEMKKIIKSHDLLVPKIKIVDKLINEKKIKIKYPTFRKYKSKSFVKKDIGIATIIFINESYIPGVISLGYSCKKYNKDFDYNLICLVQDKKYFKDGIEFPGISQDTIKDLLQVYDIIYGIDLIKIENLKNPEWIRWFKHYSNIKFYPTKCQIFSLIEYKKILFLDASNLIINNIKKIISNSGKNAFINYTFEKKYKYKIGLSGNIFILTPSLFLYTKNLFLIKYYFKIFNNLNSNRGIDEILIFYTIYDKWSLKQLIDKNIICKDYEKLWDMCKIIKYQIIKPFKKNIDNNINLRENVGFSNWDKITKELLIKYPIYTKYYNHIKEFRKIEF